MISFLWFLLFLLQRKGEEGAVVAAGAMRCAPKDWGSPGPKTMSIGAIPTYS